MLPGFDLARSYVERASTFIRMVWHSRTTQPRHDPVALGLGGFGQNPIGGHLPVSHKDCPFSSPKSA
jgi:hypothetical protein